jgi:hypothetical protein
MNNQTLQEYADPRSYVFVVPVQCIRNNPAWNSWSGTKAAIDKWCQEHQFNYQAEFINIRSEDGEIPNSHHARDYYVDDYNIDAKYLVIFYVAFATCEELSWFSLRWGYIAS